MVETVRDTLKPPPLRIGGLTIGTPTVLAPMAGLTDSPFRLLCARHHCGLVMTEVVNAQGVVHAQAQTMHYLEADAEERPVGAQLYGADPEALAEAARRIEDMGRFDLIDVNCGCPVPKIISKGAGVALMKEPQRIATMLSAIRNAVSLPVTAKTRIGLSPDQVNISEVAKCIEEGGAEVLAIHARFASVRHSGPADWEALAQIKCERSIPIIGNGGIENAGDALQMREQTGVDGVMIGRAAVGNPWIFEEIDALWNELPFTAPTIEQKRRVIEEHLYALIAHFDKKSASRRRKKYSSEQAAARHFRAHLLKYLRGHPGIREIMLRMEQIKDVRDVLSAIEDVLGRRSAA